MAKFRIAHLSDPHFGTTSPAKIRALTYSIQEQKPTLIAFSGDITQRARSTQFLEAKRFCKGLEPLPLIVVPGNHDIPLFNIAARLFFPYFSYQSIFGFPTSSKRRFGDLEIIGLNSTDPKRHVQGDLSGNDFKELEDIADESRVRVAIFHHPMDCRQVADEKNLLKNANEAHGFFERAKIDLVLNGHVHDPFSSLSNARYPEAKRPMILSVAGTCLSSRTRSGAPNSFCIVDIETEGKDVEIAIKRFDLSSEHEADMMFAPITEVRYRRSGRDHWRED